MNETIKKISISAYYYYDYYYHYYNYYYLKCDNDCLILKFCLALKNFVFFWVLVDTKRRIHILNYYYTDYMANS